MSTTIPLAPSTTAPSDGTGGARPVAPSAMASGRVKAVVLALTRHGAVIDLPGGRATLVGAPRLRAGMQLDLAVDDRPQDRAVAGGREGQAARLLTADDRRFDPPVPVRLSAPPQAKTPRSAPRPSAGVEVSARLTSPEGRAAGAPFMVRLVVRRSAVGEEQSQASLPNPGSGRGKTETSPFAARRPAAAGAATPQPSAPGTKAEGAAPLLGARVVGQDRSGRPLLRSQGITLRLETPLDLPAGSRVELALPPGLLTRFANPEPASDPLRRLLEHLHRAARGEGKDDPAGLRLPRPDAALAARLLRFMQAIRQHAPPPAPLPARQAALPAAERTGADVPLAELGRMATEAQAGGWRLWLLPLGFGAIDHLRLWTRDDDRQAEHAAEHGEPVHRAIFEIEFSELGRCQLDVFCQGRRFDLLLRSETALDAGLQREIRDLHQAALALAGWTGELGFRPRELVPLPTPPALMTPLTA